MKPILLLMGACACFCVRAQVTWHDSFSDSSLAINPTWTGDTALFIHSNDQLQLSDSDAGTAKISTTSSASTSGYWSGWLGLDFNPSASNYTEITLCEDSGGQAYVLKIGGDARDRISLIYRLPGIDYELWASSDGLLSPSNIDLEWEVVRYPDSAWTVSTNLNQAGWQNLGSAPDTSVFPSTQFSIVCFYTKTRATKFRFDNLSVSGLPFTDTTRPEVVAHHWVNRQTVDLELSEKCYSDSLHVFDDKGNLWEVFFVRAKTLQLRSSTSAENGAYIFDLSPIHDAYQNKMLPFHTILYRPLPKSVVINEVMCKPEPIVDVDYEYVELLNLTDDSLSLWGWEIKVNSSAHQLDSIVLQPHSYQVVTLSLPNSTAEIKLYDDWNEEIDHFNFSNDLHSTAWKKHGGWSLERDEYSPLSDLTYAWSSSNSNAGGTPGFHNQPETNSRSPLNSIRSISWFGDSIELLFSVGIDSLDWGQKMYLRKDNLGSRWIVPAAGPVMNFQAYSTSSYPIDSLYVHLPEALHHPPQTFISEVLFQADEGVSEFVELYNPGPGAVLLNELRISKWSRDFGIEELKPVCEIPQPMLPGEVVLIAIADPSSLFNAYPVSNVRAVLDNQASVSLAALSATDGLCIARANGSIIDSVEWDKDSYHSYLSDTRGISLTRISPGSAWQSSSQPMATPGVHSVYQSKLYEEPKIVNARFSPNGDQYKDYVELYLPRHWEQWVVYTDVYNAAGQQICSVLSGEPLVLPRAIRWDGKKNGQVLPAGQYMLVLRAENQDGRVEFWRHGCLLIDE